MLYDQDEVKIKCLDKKDGGLHTQSAIPELLTRLSATLLYDAADSAAGVDAVLACAASTLALAAARAVSAFA